jgi:hypothetical protein
VVVIIVLVPIVQALQMVMQKKIVQAFVVALHPIVLIGKITQVDIH